MAEDKKKEKKPKGKDKKKPSETPLEKLIDDSSATNQTRIDTRDSPHNHMNRTFK